MEYHPHRSVNVDEVKSVCSQRRGGQLQDIGVGKVLTRASSFADREWDDELCETPCSIIEELGWIILQVMLTPHVRVMVEGMGVEGDQRLHSKRQHLGFPGLSHSRTYSGWYVMTSDGCTAGWDASWHIEHSRGIPSMAL